MTYRSDIDLSNVNGNDRNVLLEAVKSIIKNNVLVDIYFFFENMSEEIQNERYDILQEARKSLKK